MIPSSDLDRLARSMAQRQTDAADGRPSGDPPDTYILFLGAGCARAAGLPGIEEIMQRELSRDPESGSGGAPLPAYDPADPAGSLKNFYKWLESMSPGHVLRLFHAHYAHTPVPLFYQDLALLIKSRYFNRILTTSFDTLLEQALVGAGLIPGADFEVTNFGLASPQPSRRATDPSCDTPREPVSIVKLHGDLDGARLMVTPGQVEESLKSRRRAAQQELKGDLVMVGYDGESPLLSEWLTSYRKRELWWVSAGPWRPDIASWGDDVINISGEAGSPAAFFSQLALRLLRLPALKAQRQGEAEAALYESAAQFDDGITLPEDDEAVLLEDLRGQIRRVQASLFGLEQKASPDERPRSLQVQIDYQKQQIVTLEDKLRSLATSGPRLISLLQTIADNLEGTLNDPELGQRVGNATVEFLRHQVEAVRDQYSAGEPNQQIISAAVGAAAILAERLSVEFGPRVVKAEEVRDLASFVPTVAARGIK